MSNQQKIVCIDLDGTIIHYKGWKSEDHFGDPVQGVQQALTNLKESGWMIIIFTTRGNQDLVSQHLVKHQIPYDYINKNPFQPENANPGKPYADVYVDDRGIQFNGDWQKTLEEILKFNAWELREEAVQMDAYESKANDFLGDDFGQCFSQLRHYDDMMWNVMKFSFVELLAAIGISWTIFTLSSGTDAIAFLSNLWPLASAFVLIVSYLFGNIAILMLTRLRVYYTLTAKYINEHRNFFLQSKPLGFKNESGFYTKYKDVKAYNFLSTQMVSVTVVALVNSALLAGAIGLGIYYFGGSTQLVGISAISIYILSCYLTINTVKRYLKSKDQKSADEAVFGSN